VVIQCDETADDRGADEACPADDKHPHTDTLTWGPAASNVGACLQGRARL
jgi:hypothetical protein